MLSWPHQEADYQRGPHLPRLLGLQVVTAVEEVVGAEVAEYVEEATLRQQAPGESELKEVLREHER